MQQLDLFDQEPAQPTRCVVRPFPFHRRQSVLQEIADVFLRDGFDAGNRCALQWGATLVGECVRAGMSRDEIAGDIDRFIAAWQALTIPLLAAQQDRSAAR